MPQQPRLLFGSSRAIREVLDQCERYARSGWPVLLLGEPGTGKTVLAEYIHQLSGRPGPFVKESASNLPDDLGFDDLRGHARGAFTGADRERIGLIEAAHGGTFFLDELGDASPQLQRILRQLLDQGTVRRLGEKRDRPVDVRFIAATNAELGEMVAAGTFRRDLNDRFGFLRVRLPSLVDRRDEILPLVDLFLQRGMRRAGLEERPVLSEAVRACLVAAPWRGNIRELEALCRYMLLCAHPGRPIELADLPPDFLAPLGEVLQLQHERSTAERRAREALVRADGNKTKAARLLGISRTQLYRLLSGLSAALAGIVCNLSAEMLQLGA